MSSRSALLCCWRRLSSTRRSAPRARRASRRSSPGVSGGNYELTGKVVARGRSTATAARCKFEVADRDDPSAKIPVVYTGEVPDPFADNREVIVSGTVNDGTFVAERDSLITKCPSKFADEAAQDPEHVVIQ